jgi:hypothetical protein
MNVTRKPHRMPNKPLDVYVETGRTRFQRQSAATFCGEMKR